MKTVTPIHHGITQTAHTCREWSRLAIDAYRLGLNDVGHKFSVASALYRDRLMPCAAYDELQAVYREWLIAGFPGYAHETLHARGL